MTKHNRIAVHARANHRNLLRRAIGPLFAFVIFSYGCSTSFPTEGKYEIEWQVNEDIAPYRGSLLPLDDGGILYRVENRKQFSADLVNRAADGSRRWTKPAIPENGSLLVRSKSGGFIHSSGVGRFEKQLDPHVVYEPTYASGGATPPHKKILHEGGTAFFSADGIVERKLNGVPVLSVNEAFIAESALHLDEGLMLFGNLYPLYFEQRDLTTILSISHNGELLWKQRLATVPCVRGSSSSIEVAPQEKGSLVLMMTVSFNCAEEVPDFVERTIAIRLIEIDRYGKELKRKQIKDCLNGSFIRSGIDWLVFCQRVPAFDGKPKNIRVFRLATDLEVEQIAEFPFDGELAKALPAQRGFHITGTSLAPRGDALIDWIDEKFVKRASLRLANKFGVADVTTAAITPDRRSVYLNWRGTHSDVGPKDTLLKIKLVVNQ